MKHFWRIVSDKELVYENQLIRLIELHKKLMFRLARLYGNTDEQALFIVEEAVFRAYGSKKQLRRERQPKCWLIRKLLESGEQYLLKGEVAEDTEESNNEWVYTPASGDSEQHLLMAIRTLPDKQRMAVFLRYFEDFKIDEVACILNTSDDTVKVLVYKALSQLELELEEVLTYE